MAASNGGKKENDFSDFIPIIILFCIPSLVTQVIAVALLVKGYRTRPWGRKVHDFLAGLFHGMSSRTKGDPVGQEGSWNQTRDQSWEQAQGQTQSQNWEQTRGAAQRQPSPRSAAGSPGNAPKRNRKKKRKKSGSPGTGLIIGGGITAGIFAIGTESCLADMVQYGWYELDGVLACALFMVGGLAMLFSGIGKNRRQERYFNYLSYIGANQEVDLARMAASFDVPVKKLCKDLRKMLAKGILPAGYIDLAEGKLFLTEMGYQAPRAGKAEPEPAPQNSGEQEDEILRQIRQVNDFIPDAEMSAKIDRIEEITRRILAYQKKHPNKEGQLRSFLNYYLPTTLKILRAYAQLDAQGVEGENISAAKARIEGMMDQVVAGFEKQLDKLFQDEAMDITSDVEVLEQMLKKDGLSDGEGITLEL